MNQVIQSLFHIELTTWPDYVFAGLATLSLVTWTIQVFYYTWFYARVHRYKKTNIKPDMDPVSVIICAKNEAENLKKNLSLVLDQFYPEFQVVVVNDGSKDDTPMVLAEYQLRYKNLYVTNIEHTHPFPHAKKLAQTIGIKAAKYDQLLLIDADCRPAGANWIRHMQSNFLRKNDIILGYGAYDRERKLVNAFIRSDTLSIAMQYLGFALRKNPFMGVGRNLAYRKSLFFDNKGFASQLHLQSGDDDLFVNQTATQLNTAIEIHPESITYSEPMHSFTAWFRQKRRHLTTSRHYKAKHKFLIGLEVFSRFTFYAGLIVLLSFWRFSGYLILLALARLVIQLRIVKLTTKRLNEKGIWLFYPIYDFIMPFISGTLMMRNRLRRNKKFAW